MKFHTLFFPMHLLGFLVFGASLDAQVRVTFVVHELSAQKHDSIYISGSFNQWDSLENKAYLLKPTAPGPKKITLNLPPGPIQYKFTRGSWLTVEKDDLGDEIPNRSFIIRADTTIVHTIASWRGESLQDKFHALYQQQSDTGRIRYYALIALQYGRNPAYFNLDSALYYAQFTLRLLQSSTAWKEKSTFDVKQGFRYPLRTMNLIGDLMHSLGNYPKALEIRLSGLEIAENAQDSMALGNFNERIAADYLAMKDFSNALTHAKFGDLYGLQRAKSLSKYHIAYAFYHLNQLDSALYYARLRETNYLTQADIADQNLLLADIFEKKRDNKLALTFYRTVIPDARITYRPVLEARALAGIARYFQRAGQIDSALLYARHAIATLQRKDNQREILVRGENPDYHLSEISPLVADLYKSKGQLDSAYFFLQYATSLKDSLFNTDKIRQFQTLTFNETARKEELEQEKQAAQQRYQTRLTMNALGFIIITFFIIAFILYRNNRQKQTANALLHTQKEEIEKTLAELKSTQTQLIQAEKLASLGELTAGIAHEIQNPLNFVNNFSEVSAEMLNELKEELAKGETEEAHAIADDLKTNLQKITHHGQRASSIVKNMLEHSRQGRDAMHRVSTDINALADEYLRLAYHGWRAKDNGFNCNIETHFDPDLPLVSVIPQDIGRVLLNLIGNAFYAVNERNKKGEAGYQPTVSVKSLRVDSPFKESGGERGKGGYIQIAIKDNGSGIPESIRDKIFQPFFTTKPTGQGTGLGLSLAYDIVTKGHRGALEVESTPNTGTAFVITLPEHSRN